MPFLTIFTPVYNRAYILSQLYESLRWQTCRDFEWIVVDDGSTDNIDVLMDGFIADNEISIRYCKQSNGGKHRAINHGVNEARGKMFFIVDSDDRLYNTAVEWIILKSKDILHDDSFAGISGLRVNPDGSKIGGENNFTQIDSDAISIRTKHHVTGDLAEIYKTDILRKFPFPDIYKEKFCSEGLIWNRIAMAGLRLRYYYQPIYICEYLGDGLTANRIKCRRESPEYSMLLYSELKSNLCVPLMQRLKYGILFWRYSELSSKNWIRKATMIGLPYAFLWPLSLIMRKLNK